MTHYRRTETVSARRSKAIRFAAGEAIKIINAHGHQVVDTWAFNVDDVDEFASMAHTRAMNNEIFVTEGDTLFSNQRRAVLTLEQDTSASRHDTLIAACDCYRYELLGCEAYHDNCTDNLYRAMRNMDLHPAVCPSPLNLWMNIPVTGDGSLERSEPRLTASDYVVLRAEMDCVVVLSCRPQDIVHPRSRRAACRCSVFDPRLIVTESCVHNEDCHMASPQTAAEPRALSMARALALGDLDALDVALAALDRARASESVFTAPTEDRARMEAQVAAARLRAGCVRGPLDGVPVAWKDLVDVCGMPTSAGSKALLEHRGNAQHDAPMVRNASGAGLVTIGKTNLNELAYSGLGLNPHFGTPRNPADTQTARVPGGSSSGSAVAVAAGIVPLALGTDTGGSLRVPAAFNGLVSYRPSRARYNMTGVTPLARSLDVAGPMATSVADCLAFDACLRGDEHTSRPSLRPDSIRLVVETTILNDDTGETAVADNLRAALDTLARAGVQIVWREISAVHEVLDLIASTGWLGAPEAYAEYRWLLESHSAKAMDPRVRDRLALAADMSPDRVVRLYRERERLIAACRDELEGGLLVLPTVAHVAPPLEPLERDPELFKRVNLATLRLTMIGSFLDMPTVALPTGVDDAQQHTSLQISASQSEDESLKPAALTVSRLLDIEQ